MKAGMARDDHHHHADRENEDVSVLHDEVRDVLRTQQDSLGQDREQHDHREQRDEDAVLAEIGQHVRQPRREPVLDGVDVGADRGGFGLGRVGVGHCHSCVRPRLSAASPWS
jgi:hypothetical protein